MSQTIASLQAAPCPLPLYRIDEIAHPERAVKKGEMVKVRRGVYAPLEQWLRLAPWNRYLVRVHAVTLLAPDAILCHESAAAWSAMGVIGDPVTVHVLRGPGGTSRLVGGVRVHTTADSLPVVPISGVLATGPAMTAITLARHRHHALGLAMASAALRLEPELTASELGAVNESLPNSRGRRHARWALERADAGLETVLEAVSFATIEWLGFEPPELQHVFTSAEGVFDRGDQWWPEYGVLGEADGDVKYDGTYGDPVDALRARRERDIRLMAGDVRSIVHHSWTEATRVDPLRAHLLGAGLQQQAPEKTSELASTRRLLAPRAPRPSSAA